MSLSLADSMTSVVIPIDDIHTSRAACYSLIDGFFTTLGSLDLSLKEFEKDRLTTYALACTHTQSK
jgi:hypothetical protein